MNELIIRNFNKLRIRRFKNTSMMPNIFKNEPQDEYSWRYKFCLKQCVLCFALTTITFIKNDIPVLTFCCACGKSNMHTEEEIIG